MSLFVLFSWIFCLSTSFLLILIFLRYRYLFIKPSFIIIAFFHLQIQWIATIRSGYVENYLPEPSSFFILVQLFPLIGLMGSFFFFHRSTAKIFLRLGQRSLESPPVSKAVVLTLVIIILVVTVFYLNHVTVKKTGLYTIFVNPEKSAEAREISLKLVDNPIIKYSYSFLIHVFSPLLSVFIIIFILKNIRLKFFQCSLALLMLIFTFFAVSLTGARTPAAFLLLAIIWALYLRNGMPIRPVYLVIALLLVLTPPVLLSILREGKIISIPLFFQYMKGGIFYRTFIMPMEVGLYHVYHAQIHGYFGIAAIPKIATLLGIQPINVANLIYRNYLYYSITLPTGLANSSYVLSYYSYFGILSVIGSLFCLWLLDFSIVLFKRIKNDMILVACLSSILPISISFVSIDFTIALVTNGFLLLLFVVWMLDKMNDYFSKNEI